MTASDDTIPTGSLRSLPLPLLRSTDSPMDDEPPNGELLPTCIAATANTHKQE